MEENWKKVSGDSSADFTWNGKEQTLNKGDEIVGVLVGVKRDVGKYKSSIFQIKTADNKVGDVWTPTVLRDKLDSVPMNSKVRIVYLGEKPSKNFGNPYKDFDVMYVAPQEDSF